MLALAIVLVAGAAYAMNDPPTQQLSVTANVTTSDSTVAPVSTGQEMSAVTAVQVVPSALANEPAASSTNNYKANFRDDTAAEHRPTSTGGRVALNPTTAVATSSITPNEFEGPDLRRYDQRC